jgi:hypothetical protein
LEVEMVTEWLSLLRIDPYADRYPVLERHSPCPKCGARSAHGAPANLTKAAWPA